MLLGTLPFLFLTNSLQPLELSPESYIISAFIINEVIIMNEQDPRGLKTLTDHDSIINEVITTCNMKMPIHALQMDTPINIQIMPTL